MKIKVKYLTELSKGDIIQLSSTTTPIEVTWHEGKVYKVEWL